jgi:hypothetical protein
MREHDLGACCETFSKGNVWCVVLPLGSGSSLSLGRSGSRSPVTSTSISLPGGSTSWRGTCSCECATSTTSTSSPLSVESLGSGDGFVSTWNLSLLNRGVLVLLSLGIAVEVQISHDVPLSLAGRKSATETEDLTSQHPPDQTNGVTALVVGWDGYVNVFGGRVGVAESDDGDIDIGCFLDGLGVGAGVGDNDQTWFLERAGNVIGEVTWGEATCDGDGAGVGGELKDSTLAVRTGGNNANVGGVVNGDDNTGCEDDFLPFGLLALVLGNFCYSPDGTVEAYQVLPMLMTLIPSGRVFQRYGYQEISSAL